MTVFTVTQHYKRAAVDNTVEVYKRRDKDNWGLVPDVLLACFYGPHRIRFADLFIEAVERDELADRQRALIESSDQPTQQMPVVRLGGKGKENGGRFKIFASRNLN